MSSTIIEKVVPAPVPERIDRVDAWRWENVVGYDEYLAQVRAREAAWASRRAVEAYTEKLVEPACRGVA